MDSCKFYKITLEAIKLYLNNSLNEQSLSDIINRVRLKGDFKNEVIYHETQLIKYLFTSKKYYEIESFCKEFITFINNMPCKRKADIMLISAILNSISDRLRSRIYSQVDIHIYELLKINYMVGINEKNIFIILENSNYMDDAIGVNLAESYTYEQYSLFTNSPDASDNSRENFYKSTFFVKDSIQKDINSVILEYYNSTTLKEFIDSFNSNFKNITLDQDKKRNISYLFDLKMKYYFKQAVEIWENKKKKAKKAIKNYTLPLDYE